MHLQLDRWQCAAGWRQDESSNLQTLAKLSLSLATSGVVPARHTCHTADPTEAYGTRCTFEIHEIDPVMSRLKEEAHVHECYALYP